MKRSIVAGVTFTFALSALVTAGCAADPSADEGFAASENAVTRDGALCGLPPLGSSTMTCAVIAPAGANIRREASTGAGTIQPKGWGGLPCGWELTAKDVDDQGGTFTYVEDGERKQCTTWGRFTTTAAGVALDGWIASTYVACATNATPSAFLEGVRSACPTMSVNGQGSGATSGGPITIVDIDEDAVEREAKTGTKRENWKGFDVSWEKRRADGFAFFGETSRSGTVECNAQWRDADGARSQNIATFVNVPEGYPVACSVEDVTGATLQIKWR